MADRRDVSTCRRPPTRQMRPNRDTLNVIRPRKKNSSVVEQVSAPVTVKAGLSRPPVPLPADQADAIAATTILDTSEPPDTSDSESVFTKRKLQVADAWEDLRKSTLRAVVESMCLPDGAQCCNCHEVPAEVRCVQCGPTVFLCQQCTISLHKTIRLSHTPEIWKVT